MSNGSRYLGRWYQPAIDHEANAADWPCRDCGKRARMVGIRWCLQCADARIEARKREPAELARAAVIARGLREIDRELARRAYDAATLRRWFAWVDRARLFDVECTTRTTVAIAHAMIEVLPAVPIRVDSILPFQSHAVYESKVAEYLADRGEHPPVVVVGWPDRGERQLVDGRHRMSAATVLGLEAIPACFAMFADARRWGDGGCW